MVTNWYLKNYGECLIYWKVERSLFLLSHEPDLCPFPAFWIGFLGVFQHSETHETCSSRNLAGMFQKLVETKWKKISLFVWKISETWKNLNYFGFMGLNDILVL